MKMKITGIALGAIALLSAGAFFAGCGSSDEADSSSTSDEAATVATDTDDTEASTSASTSAQSGGPTLNVKMGEYYFTPSIAETTAGSVTVDAPNEGALPHELVLAKTNLNAAKLPTLPDGSVDEASLDSPGEVGETAPGESGSTTLDLKPGKYVMFCNLPAHYAAGMYGTLTVK